MRKTILGIVRAVIFLTILVISLFFINRTLVPKYILTNSRWPTTSTYYQFYEMEENSIDALFLGSSVTVNAFSPQEIYNNYGIRSYNLGSEQQDILVSYYWLKEALRFQSPKVVVFDTKMVFDNFPGNPLNMSEELIRKSIDPMRWSDVKAEAVKEICRIDENQTPMSYYFPNIRFHTRWEDLEEYDFVKEEFSTSELKGFSPLNTYGQKEYRPYENMGDSETRLEAHPIMIDYLYRMIDLCKEKNIKLVFVSIPGNAMTDAIRNTLMDIMEPNGIDFINMCETDVYEALNVELPRENTINHANLWGAVKMSDYMGKYFANQCGLQPVSDAQYEATKPFYEHIKNMCELKHIDDMNEYLDMIQRNYYTVFMAAREDASNGLTEDIIYRMLQMGLQTPAGMYRWSYAAVLSPENGVSEGINEMEPVVLSGSIRDGKTFYTVTSTGYNAGNKSTIVIDGAEYNHGLRGLYIVVYDNELMKVVDEVTFDTSGECNAVR